MVVLLPVVVSYARNDFLIWILEHLFCQKKKKMCVLTLHVR